MKAKIRNFLIVLIIPAVLMVLFSCISGGFGFHSFSVILNQTMLPAAMGLGLCAVSLSGMVDLAIGARVVLGAVMGGLMSHHFGVAGLLAGCFLGAFASAAVQAGLYRLLRIPSMVLSVGIIMIYEVLAAFMTKGFGHVLVDSSVSVIGSFPYNMILFLVAAVSFYLIYYHTRMGRQLKAVGNNEDLCRGMGIKADRIKVLSYMMSALMCGFASVLSLCYSGSVSIAIGSSTLSMIFKPLMGVMIGMQMVKLYDNLPLLIFIGEFAIQIVFNGFIALGMSDAWQNIILGIFILAVMMMTNEKGPAVHTMRRRISRRHPQLE